MNASMVAPPLPPFDPTMQCEAVNVIPMLASLVAVYASGFSRHSMAFCCAIGVSAFCITLYSLNVREIKELTLAHLGGCLRLTTTPRAAAPTESRAITHTAEDAEAHARLMRPAHTTKLNPGNYAKWIRAAVCGCPHCSGP